MESVAETIGTVIISIAFMIFAYKITRWFDGKNNNQQRRITRINKRCS